MNDHPLLGKTIRLNQDRGPLRTCRFCSADVGVIKAGVTPHIAQIRCQPADHFCGWLGKNDFTRLEGLARG